MDMLPILVNHFLIWVFDKHYSPSFQEFLKMILLKKEGKV